MATVNPRIGDIVAHDRGVIAAVRVERDKVLAIAEGLFAPHDNPGGHRLTTSDGKVDALVILEGPSEGALLGMEYGHWQRTNTGPRYVEGLHILGRAVAQAAL